MMHERLVVTLLISGIINSACTNRIHEDKMSVITLDSISRASSKIQGYWLI